MSDDKSRQIMTNYDMLTPTQRAFVIARARGRSVAQATKDLEIARNTPATNWDMDIINAAIHEVQTSWAANPNDAMQALLPLALEQLEALIKCRSFEAIQEVFNRVWGKAVQRQEISGPAGGPIEVQPIDYRVGINALKPDGE